MSKYSKKLTAMIIVIMLLGSFTILPLPTVYGSDGKVTTVEKTKQVDMGSLGKEVKFLGNSTIKLKEFFLIPVENGQVLYSTFEVNNKSSVEIDFFPYWIQMQSKGGTRFPVSMVDKSKSSRILPATKQSFSYYSLVPTNMKSTDTVLRLIKWDFSMPNYERPIYTFKSPERVITPTVTKGESHTIDIQESPVSTSITNVQVSTNARSKTFNIKMSYINQGRRSVTLPGFSFVVNDTDGYSYPVVSKTGDSAVNALPRIEGDIELTVEVPRDADISNYVLTASETKADLQHPFSIPIANYGLVGDGRPTSPDTEGSGISGQYKVGEEVEIVINGQYFNMSLDNVRRLPSLSFDNILAYDLTIKNNSKMRVNTPELSSTMIISGQRPVSSYSIEDKKYILFPDEEVTLTMLGEFSEEMNLSNGMVITIQNGDSSGQDMKLYTEELASFEVLGNQIKTELNIVKKAHHFKGLGIKSTLELNQTSVFDFKGSDIISSTFLLENKDSRPFQIPKYKAFFKSADGDIFPATYKEVKDGMINPRSSLIVTYWAVAPKGIDLNKLTLVIGKPLEKSTETLHEYAAFVIPEEDTAPAVVEFVKAKDQKDHTFSHKMYPFTFTVKKMKLLWDGLHSQFGVKIGAQFDLHKTYSNNIVVEGEQKKLVFEFVDSINRNIYFTSNELSMKDDLVEGINFVQIESNNWSSNMILNIYETFEDGRKLIATYDFTR
jgi:hypothetical protein